jgi:chitinase
VNQQLARIAEYADRLNIMTYDMSGSFDPVTGHHSNLRTSGKAWFSTERVVELFLEAGVPCGKINIGTPLYSRGWAGVTAPSAADALYKPGTGGAPMYDWRQLKVLVNSEGYEQGYDAQAEAAYIYNRSAGLFFSYENERSLQAKLDYINEKGLGGLIVWEAGGDDAERDFPMISLMSAGLGIK